MVIVAVLGPSCMADGAALIWYATEAFGWRVTEIEVLGSPRFPVCICNHVLEDVKVAFISGLPAFNVHVPI